MTMGTSLGGTFNANQDYALMKYKEWVAKMMCGQCKDRENEVILTCGHLSCQQCIDTAFENRRRSCSHCGQKISKTDVLPIFWGGKAEDI